jgi:FKBP-type peptidyl-prolyl cis-trans isomerase SlyD
LQITKDCVVTFSYKLFTLQGDVIEETELGHSAAYLHGGYNGIFPRVETAMEGKGVGDEVHVTLEPEDAFGDYDAELVRMEPAHLFPEDVRVGMQFEGATEDGSHQLIYTVTDLAEGKVVLDGNHPLAGQGLRVQCRVEDVRQATSEEIAHGHSHGEGGHEHH